MKKEDRKRALEFMEAYLDLCRTFRCSIEEHVDPRDCDHQADGVEVHAWVLVDDADAFFANDHKLLAERIEAGPEPTNAP